MSDTQNPEQQKADPNSQNGDSNPYLVAGPSEPPAENNPPAPLYSANFDPDESQRAIPKPPKNKLKPQIISGFLVIILALIGAGIYFFYQINQSESSTVTTTRQVDVEEDVGGGKIRIQTPVTETVDCGDKDCFSKKFKDCEPANLQVKSGLASVYYKILVPDGDGCKMIFKYTENPNPEWVDKEMTCTFDNKIDFEKSVEEAFNNVVQGTTNNCEGSLVNILRTT